jgi:hypothetical protein
VSRPLPNDPPGNEIIPPGPAKPRLAPTPRRAYEPTGTPGVYKGPDGKLETRIPENEQARWAQPHSFLDPKTAWAFWAAEQERLRTICESMLAQDYGPLEVRVFVMQGETTIYCSPHADIQNLPKAHTLNTPDELDAET